MMEQQQPQQQQPQQQQLSPSQRTFFAALDGVIEEAVNSVLNDLRGRHVSWHKDLKNEPSGKCHPCVLLGIAQAPDQQTQPHTLDDAPMKPRMDNGEVQPDGGPKVVDPFPHIPAGGA